MQYKLVQS